MQHVLSELIWIPILSGILVFTLGSDKYPRVSRWLTLLTVLFTLGMCIPLLRAFDPNLSSMQFVEDLSWMPTFGIRYSLGIDGLALLLIVLSIFTNLIVVLATWSSIKKKNRTIFCSIFNYARILGRGVFRYGLHTFLCVLGSHFDSYVFDNWDMGFGQSRLCGY